MSIENTETARAPDDDEIDLLDLLIVITENLKLLVLGPLVAGIAALGLAFLLPKTFESQSLLVPAKSGVSVSGAALVSQIRSADVLEDVAKALNLFPDLSEEQRFKRMSTLVSASEGKQDKLISLSTRGATPEAAQQLNHAVWARVLPLTVPKPKEMARLEEQLKAEKERLASGVALEASTNKRLENSGASESTARLYGELLTTNSNRLRAITILESQMEGLTVEELAQAPTLPETAIKPRKSIIAIAASLGMGVLLLLFVFVRHGLRSAAQDPQQASKVARLYKSLGLKAPSVSAH